MAVKRPTDEVHDTSELLARRCCRVMRLAVVGTMAVAVGCVSPSTNRHVTTSAVTSAPNSEAPVTVAPVTVAPVMGADATQPLERLQPVELVSLVDPSSDTGPSTAESLPDPAPPESDKFPIDLPTALQLAGANNLQIALASERVEQAYASINAADARWVPSLNLGIVYNQHDGQLQATEGDVRQISRSSLFVGGGVGLGGAPLPGGSSGPARLFVNLSLADVLFDPLAARQVADAVEADETAVFNDTLLQVAVSYLQLVRATSRVAILEVAVQHSERLAKITTDFARAGEGYEADAQRAAAALASQRRGLLRSLEDEQVASASLARLLRLDPTITLLPTDQHAIPIDMVSTNDSLDDLILQAIAARPEVARQESMVAESFTRIDQEHWRPLLPNVYAGFNGGGFGGSGGSDIKNFSDKTDFDVVAIWQLENFGFGNAARRRMQDSRHRQAHLASDQARDTVALQVTEAYSRVQSRKKQIAAVASEIEAADRALVLNFDGIRGAVLRPIEAQQAINAFVDARLEQLDTVVSYNAAQLELLRAIGLPPQAAVLP